MTLNRLELFRQILPQLGMFLTQSNCIQQRTVNLCYFCPSEMFNQGTLENVLQISLDELDRQNVLMFFLRMNNFESRISAQYLSGLPRVSWQKGQNQYTIGNIFYNFGDFVHRRVAKKVFAGS